jgi:phosphoglycolate phosphatase
MPCVEHQGKRIPCRLVIFDKDGTLLDFTATWIPLIQKRADCVVKALGKDGDLKAALLRAWGIDPLTGRVDPRGPCPVALRSEEIVIGTQVLYETGHPWDDSKQLVIQAFDQADATGDRRKMLKPVNEIESVLHRLKSQGFSLALATSDERKDTDDVLTALGLEGLFDAVLCAGEGNPPKPHPEMLLAICEKLSIPPEEAVFVGDTVTDMIMGRRAGLGLTIGILEGGVTPREELEKVADLVLDSIRDLASFPT